MNGGIRSEQQIAQHRAAGPDDALGPPPPEPLAVLRRRGRLVRRFAERCAELYTFPKIRCFLPLYTPDVPLLRALDVRPRAGGPVT
ncbi:hypothetical protein SCE1572_36830 [Sorangium cellulosum So0157-2]|uniref:Uncharacterized protein n=1 Tax=Sorangium cellulosum So0157-2 TaxID=1254432 RepID=S4Y9V8_SORCE|nr:hypothetical protein SCE1572_36830 [Sorangium cellulosum So0157-2]